MLDTQILIFAVNEGALYDARGRLCDAYSGRPGFRTTEHERSHFKGAIPRGRWKLGKPYHSSRVGPLAIPLTPLPGTNTFGRSAFLIHGDDAEGDASAGCIIAHRGIRANFATALAAGREFVLYVVGDVGDLRPDPPS